VFSDNSQSCSRSHARVAIGVSTESSSPISGRKKVRGGEKSSSSGIGALQNPLKKWPRAKKGKKVDQADGTKNEQVHSKGYELRGGEKPMD